MEWQESSKAKPFATLEEVDGSMDRQRLLWAVVIATVAMIAGGLCLFDQEGTEGTGVDFCLLPATVAVASIFLALLAPAGRSTSASIPLIALPPPDPASPPPRV